MNEHKELLRAVVVDDERVIADSLAMILRASGWEAMAAYSGEEAVHKCEALDPHVVIADIVMAPMSGFDLAIYLAEHWPQCRIILMSGHSFHEPLVAKSVRRGFEFLPKPIDPSRLLTLVCGPATSEEPPEEPLQEASAAGEQ
ncbi:MAG: response regulator [Acidobacteriota bacterium]